MTLPEYPKPNVRRSDLIRIETEPGCSRLYIVTDVFTGDYASTTYNLIADPEDESG